MTHLDSQMCTVGDLGILPSSIDISVPSEHQGIRETLLPWWHRQRQAIDWQQRVKGRTTVEMKTRTAWRWATRQRQISHTLPTAWTSTGKETLGYRSAFNILLVLSKMTTFRRWKWCLNNAWAKVIVKVILSKIDRIYIYGWTFPFCTVMMNIETLKELVLTQKMRLKINMRYFTQQRQPRDTAILN